MSDSQAYEEVTVGSDGVTVTKRFEEDEFPVPAIAFEFTSDRDEEVRVQLEDTVPDSVAVEDLGFHPEYGSEYWTIDEDEISFERELEADAEYTTVYGIRATGTDDVEKFLTRPEVTDVDPPLPEAEKPAANDGGEDVIPESDDDVVRDVISGDNDEVPGLDDEAEDEIETLDLKDPNEEGGGTGEESSDGSGDADSGGDGGSVSVSGNNLVSALAAELRQNEVSAEDVKLLRQAFEIAGQEGGSIQARVERIQQDIADLRAYTDAMEEFLDENGTAQQLIEDFESDVDSLQETVGTIQSQMAEHDDQVSAVSDEVSSLGSDVAEVSEEVESVSSDVESVSDDVSTVESSIEDVEDSLADVEDTIADLQEHVTEGDVAERLDGFESELEDLQEWQDQIKETFGG